MSRKFGEQSFGEDDRLRARRHLQTRERETIPVEEALRRVRAPAASEPAPREMLCLEVEAISWRIGSLHKRELKPRSDLVMNC